ncbi:MAG: PilT/PilU family type 4a pilus ATPase [Eubacteriales bacterium]|nr:PilT/PilU family type 4a pilus ATPase [Eubacteriales bacterium]
MIYSDKIDGYLDTCISARASDLHLKASMNPFMRYSGGLKSIDAFPLDTTEVYNFIQQVLTPEQKEKYASGGEADFSFSYSDYRFRCNAYHDLHGDNLALRLLALEPGDFSNLGIPLILKDFSKKRSGLILITGPTGSGKSTTLTCMIDYINENKNAHIITLEDPVEYIHTSKKCVITQREIGKNTKSFGKAIEAAMRQDPDIIMVGEMRDLESVAAAIAAAETGHLVLSTLHTKGAESTVDRIIDMFPAAQQNQIRVQLGMTLLLVCCQQLVPGLERGRRHLAAEVMVCNQAIRNLIRVGKTHMISSTMQTSRKEGMFIMKDSLEKLYTEGKISEDDKEQFMF